MTSVRKIISSPKRRKKETAQQGDHNQKIELYSSRNAYLLTSAIGATALWYLWRGSNSARDVSLRDEASAEAVTSMRSGTKIHNTPDEDNAKQAGLEASLQKIPGIKIPIPPVSEVGLVHEKNKRQSQEDRHVISQNFYENGSSSFLAVFDGHMGAVTVDLLKHYYENIFKKKLGSPPELLNTEEILEAFVNTHKELDGIIKKNSDYFSGSTSTAALVVRAGTDDLRPNAAGEDAFASEDVNDIQRLDSQSSRGKRMIYIANTGDSRIVLCRKNGPLRLTRDFKPTEKDEISRIKAAGGSVEDGRVNGILAVTRAFGDLHININPNNQVLEIIISDPQVHAYEVEDGDSYIIVASDGLWDIVSDEQACAAAEGVESGQDLAARLYALAKGAQNADNTTILVGKL